MTRRTKTEQLDPRTRGTTCIANRKNGEKCKRWAIRGGTVCASHGGSAPQVKRKAQERIDAAADNAAAKLIEFMNSNKVPFPVRLQAARDLLDRAGLKAGSEVTVKLARFEQDFEGLFVDIVDGEVVEEPQLGSGDRSLVVGHERR